MESCLDAIVWILSGAFGLVLLVIVAGGTRRKPNTDIHALLKRQKELLDDLERGLDELVRRKSK